MRSICYPLIVLLMFQPLLAQVDSTSCFQPAKGQNSVPKLYIELIGKRAEDYIIKDYCKIDENGWLIITDKKEFSKGWRKWQAYLGSEKISETEFLNITGNKQLVQYISNARLMGKKYNRIFLLAGLGVVIIGVTTIFIGTNSTEPGTKLVYDPYLGYHHSVVTESKPNHFIMITGAITTFSGGLMLTSSLLNQSRFKIYKVYPYDLVKKIADEYNTEIDSSNSIQK